MIDQFGLCVGRPDYIARPAAVAEAGTVENDDPVVFAARSIGPLAARSDAVVIVNIGFQNPTQSQDPRQEPEQRSPNCRNCRYLYKGKQKRPLSSWESKDIASIPMELLRKEQSLVLWCLSASLLLSSCAGTGPECGSLETRNSVVKIVSDDTNNKLVNYAVKNSSSVAAMVGDTKSEAEKLGIWEKARQGAVYRLDDTILMNSRNRAAQECTCIGLMYVTVADATAQKEIEFKVKQTADGKIIVSVNPFLF